jgi:hypothetical protein
VTCCLNVQLYHARAIHRRVSSATSAATASDTSTAVRNRKAPGEASEVPRRASTADAVNSSFNAAASSARESFTPGEERIIQRASHSSAGYTAATICVATAWTPPTIRRNALSTAPASVPGDGASGEEK